MRGWGVNSFFDFGSATTLWEVLFAMSLESLRKLNYLLIGPDHPIIIQGKQFLSPIIGPVELLEQKHLKTENRKWKVRNRDKRGKQNTEN